MSEFARGRWTVLFAALGVGLAVSGLLAYAGPFARDLAGEIGLGRTAFGVAFFGSTLAMAIAMPFVGRLADRLGPRLMAVFGSVMLSAGFVIARHGWQQGFLALLFVQIRNRARASSTVAGRAP